MFSSRISITAITVIVVIAVSILTVYVTASAIVLANAEQIQGQDTITIIPGASNKNNPAFFDIMYYPYSSGKRIKVV